MESKEQGGALSVYRVLDLTDSRGAYCSKLLADLSADVIKIESSENLDFMRTIAAEKNSSAGFNESNRNKHGRMDLCQ